MCDQASRKTWAFKVISMWFDVICNQNAINCMNCHPLLFFLTIKCCRSESKTTKFIISKMWQCFVALSCVLIFTMWSARRNPNLATKFIVLGYSIDNQISQGNVKNFNCLLALHVLKILRQSLRIYFNNAILCLCMIICQGCIKMSNSNFEEKNLFPQW